MCRFARFFITFLFSLSFLPFISSAEAKSPYWAGFETKEIKCNECDSDFTLTIKYSKDGKKYKIIYLLDSFSHVEGTCEGEIYKDGDIEEIECDKDSGGTRTISGKVTELTLESSSTMGGGVWKLDKHILARKKSSQKLEKKTLLNPFLSPPVNMPGTTFFSDALSKLTQEKKTGIKLEKIKFLRKQKIIKRKIIRTSYLESSRYMHIYKKLSGWDFDSETMTYNDGSNRIHLGILKSYEDIAPENLKYIKRIFPLRKGKKFTYDLSRGSSEWQYIAEVKEEYKKKDPELGEIYCFRIEGTFENKWTSWIREREGILCPVYGMSFQFLDTGPTVKIKKENTTYRKLLSLSKTKTAFRVESKNSKTTLINLFEEKAKQLRLIEVKRKKEQERKDELERKRKKQEKKERKLLAERKRKKEIDRKKREAELRKKRKTEIARKKKQAELARKKEIARKKLLAKQKLEVEKKRRKILSERKRKRELQLRLFPPLFTQATELSNDLQLFLQKNSETPYLIEIASLIGKVKESQKKKEVLRLKKRLNSLRKLLPKVKGYSAFEANIQKARAISKLKLLTKKVKSGKELRSFLKLFIAKNMLSDLETVQKILPVLKKLDASLKSPKLDELNKLIRKTQHFILKTSSLRKEIHKLAKLRKKKELAHKRELEAKRKRELEEKHKRTLEAKRKREESLKKQKVELKKEKKVLSKKEKFKKKIAKLDDLAITEIVQNKLDEKKFKEARRYAKHIKDLNIRTLLLSEIKKENKSNTEKKKKSQKEKHTIKLESKRKKVQAMKPNDEIQKKQKEANKTKLLAVRKRVEELKKKYALKKEKLQKKQ